MPSRIEVHKDAKVKTAQHLSFLQINPCHLKKRFSSKFCLSKINPIELFKKKLTFCLLLV